MPTIIGPIKTMGTALPINIPTTPIPQEEPVLILDKRPTLFQTLDGLDNAGAKLSIWCHGAILLCCRPRLAATYHAPPGARNGPSGFRAQTSVWNVCRPTTPPY